MERIVEQGILYDFYGSLLTKHQQKIYEMVVYHDLSLQEVAQQEGISKQAVSDLMSRSTAQMIRFENALGMIRRFRQIQNSLDVLESEAEEAADSEADAKTRSFALQVMDSVSQIRKELQ